MKRLIKPIPAVGVELAPPNCAVVDLHYDYITMDDDEDETGCVYICYKLKVPTPEYPDGFAVIYDYDVKFGKHTFAGWPPPEGKVKTKKPKPV